MNEEDFLKPIFDEIDAVDLGLDYYDSIEEMSDDDLLDVYRYYAYDDNGCIDFSFIEDELIRRNIDF